MSERVAEEERLVNLNRDRNDELARTNEQLRVQIKNLQDFKFSHDKILSLQAQELKNLVEMSNLMGNMGKNTRAWADSQAKIASVAEDMLRKNETAFSRLAGFTRDIVEMQQNRAAVEKEVQEALEKQGLTLEEYLENKDRQLMDEKTIKKVKEKIAKLEKSGTEEAKATAAALQKRLDVEKAIKNLPEDTKGLVDSYEKIVEASDKIQNNMKRAALEKVPEFIGKAVGKVADAYGKVNSIASEMYKTTGGNIKLMDNIQASFQDGSILGMASMGIGFENISEAMVNLNQKSGAFAIASAEVQKEVGIVATKLERLGVSAEASGELFDTLRLNFGFSALEFDDMADTFVGRASDIGMSVQQYTQDFQASYHVLGKYGTDSVNVFDKLARHARASGMSVQELATAMSDDNFGTFSSAAENASKLNFLLGSQLDTTQLLMADEAERLDMIKGAFSPAQFQNMDKFKKKAIAAAAGFSDVGAFEKAMRGDVEGLGDLAKSNQEKLDDAVVKSTSAQEAMSKAIENSKDQMVLAMAKMSEQLGVKGQTMYGGVLAASTALQNFASIVQLASAAQAIPGGAGGMLKTVAGKTGMSKAYGAFTAQRSSGASLLSSARGSWGAALNGATSAGKLAGFGGMLASGAMVAKDTFDVGSALLSGEDVKKEDLGGMIGGVIGGAVGIIGGPAGIALGAGIGNMLGESLGSIFDEEKEEKKKQDKKTDRQIELLEESNKINERAAKAQEKQEQWNQNKRNFAHVVNGIDSRKGIRGS